MRQGAIFCFCLFSAAVFLMGISGCNRGPKDGRALVQGEITLDGVPVESGQIVFADPTEVAAGGGAKIVNGQYELHAPPIPMEVRITAYREVPGKFMELNPGVKTAVIEQYLPERYNEKTELSATIAKKLNRIDFKLESK